MQTQVTAWSQCRPPVPIYDPMVRVLKLSMEAVEYLWTKDSSAVNEILQAILRVSGLMPEEEAAAEDSFPGRS